MTGPAREASHPGPASVAGSWPSRDAYPSYPTGTMHRLLATDLVTPRTREVLEGRIAAQENRDTPEPRFFTRAELATLDAACARLIPQPDRDHPIDLASAIDERLAAGKGNGWRYDSMPPDPEAYRRAMRGLNETALSMLAAAASGADSRQAAGESVEASFESLFMSLDESQQDAVLRRVQHGDAPGAVWETMPSARFFELLLTEVAIAYYSNPLGQDEIGYAGYADAHGWQHIGLDELERFEPRAVQAANGGHAPGEVPDR